MFVKIYSYHIKSDKEEEYLKIQQEADGIYSRFIDEKTLHLQSKKDKTKWLEIHVYKNEKIYNDSIQIIDRMPEIQVLYKRFIEVINSVEEMAEEDYQLIDFLGGKQDCGLR